MLGKEIKIEEDFKEENKVDIHSVTKGKGVKGPVKRFGITIQGRKKEKSKIDRLCIRDKVIGRAHV